MGVRNYLIEGVSCSGKTSVAEELQRRGHHVIHGDRDLAYLGDPETGKPLAWPDPEGLADTARWWHERWIWNVEKVQALLADHRHSRSFFCGGSRNRDRYVDRFDRVFVLELDVETLNQRLLARPKNEFGGEPEARRLISQLHATRQDLPKDATPIDATAPLAQVVDEILAKCSERSEPRPAGRG